MAGRLSNAQNASTKSPGRLSTQSEVATSTAGRLNRTASPATTSQPVIQTEEKTKEPAKKTGLFSRLGQAFTNTADKVGNALGNTVGRALVENTVKVSQNIGQTLASVSPDVEGMRESKRRLDDSQIKLLKMINENNKKGKDSSRLIKQFNSNTEKIRDEGEILPVLDKTNLQVIADWAGLGLDIATVGTISAGGKQLAKEGIKQTVKQSGKRLAAEGAVIGASYGTTGAMQEGERNVGRIALSGAIGAAAGAAIPTAIAGVGRLAGKLAPKAAKEVSEGVAKIATRETAPIEQKIARNTDLLDNIPSKGITDQNGAVLAENTTDYTKPMKAVRYYGEGYADTSAQRGGSWYTIGDEKNYKFNANDPKYTGRGVGGIQKAEGNLSLQKPLVIKNAMLEDGSFSVINSGYEKELPTKQREIAEKIYDLQYSTETKNEYDNALSVLLRKNGNTEEEIKTVLSHPNKGDVALDLVISKGLKENGYDSLILENTGKNGEILDRHAFDFGSKKEIAKAQIPADAEMKQSSFDKSIANSTPTIKRSGFSERIADSPVTAPEVQKGLKANPQTYEVARNPETVAKARSIIEKYGTERASQAVRQAEKLDATIIGTGEELIKEYQQRGDFDLAIDMANDVSEKLTKAGQAIQAAKIYENLSPEAVLVRATKFVKKENQKVIKGGEFIAKKNELSPTDAEALYRIAEEMQNATGDLKTELAAEIGGILGKYKRVGIGKKISGIQTQMQLLNPKTLVTRNPLGNELFYRLERINKYVATPIDIVRSKLTGADRTVTFKTINQESFWKNWVKGGKAGWNRQTLGPNTQFDIAQFTFKNRLNPFYWGERALGAALKSFDYAAYKRGVGDTLGEMAYLKAINEGYKGNALKKQAQQYALKMDDKAHEIADQYGKYITFQDENVLSKGMIKVKSALNLQQDFGVGDLLIKYPKTPGALLMRALEYSPAGFIRSMYQVAMPVTSKATSREIVQSVSRAVVGTLGLTGLGYYLADKGMITGKRDDKATVRGLEEETGKGEYKINISAIKRWVLSGFTNTRISDKDILYTYDWAQPVSVALSIGANMNSEDPDLSGPAAAALSGVNTIIEQPLFSGLTNWLKYGDFVKGTQGVLEGLPASFTPTLSNQFRQYVDNIRRQTKGDSSTETAINRVLNRIPGQSEKLAPQIGIFGEAKKNFEKNNVFNIFLNPGNVTTFKESPEANLALSLLESTGETKQMPKVVDKDVTLFGQKYRMTNEEQAAMQQFVGRRSLIILGKAAESEKFATLSEEEKVNELSRLLTDLGSNVRLLLMAKKIQEAKEEGDKEALKIMSENVPQGKEAELRAAFEYLKTHDPFEIKLPENNGNNRGEEKKKDSSMLNNASMMLGGLGIAAVSKGKNTKLLKEATEQMTKSITKEATITAEKALPEALLKTAKEFLYTLEREYRTPVKMQTVEISPRIITAVTDEGEKPFSKLNWLDKNEADVYFDNDSSKKFKVIDHSPDGTSLLIPADVYDVAKSKKFRTEGERLESLFNDNTVQKFTVINKKHGLKEKVSNEIIPDGKELIATHSTTAKNLKKILESDGIFGPSVAIKDLSAVTGMKQADRSYGNYHVVVNNKSLNPKNRDVAIFSDDAYTPRQITDEASLSVLKQFDKENNLIANTADGKQKTLLFIHPELNFIERIKSVSDLYKKARSRLTTASEASQQWFDRRRSIDETYMNVFGEERELALDSSIDHLHYDVDQESQGFELLGELSSNRLLKDPIKATEYFNERLIPSTGDKITVKEMKKFLAAAQQTFNTYKTYYMEAKFLKKIDLSKDIESIVIPHNAPKHIIDGLEKKKIPFFSYNARPGSGVKNKSLVDALKKAKTVGLNSIVFLPLNFFKKEDKSQQLEELKSRRDQLKKENEELTAKADELSRKKQQEKPQLNRITTPVIVQREGREVDVNDINQLIELYKVNEGKYSGPKRTIGNLDLETKKYATNPEHIRSIKAIYEDVKDYDTKQMQEEFKRLGSPLQYITDQLEVALEHYGITPGEFIAVVRQDSGAGTSGWRAIENKNPGNVGNIDNGSNIKFDTWIEGSVAAIRNLAERKVK